MKTYTATVSSLCECCDQGIRRGMPVSYVRPFDHWRNAHERTVAIHTRCVSVYELEQGGEALYRRAQA